jgi:hypothetical protein
MRAILPALAFRLGATVRLEIPEIFGPVIIARRRQFTANANQFADDLLYYMLLRKDALEFPLTATDLLSEYVPLDP